MLLLYQRAITYDDASGVLSREMGVAIGINAVLRVIDPTVGIRRLIVGVKYQIVCIHPSQVKLGGNLYRLTP